MNQTEGEHESVGELHEGEQGQHMSDEPGITQASLPGWRALKLLNRRMITRKRKPFRISQHGKKSLGKIQSLKSIGPGGTRLKRGKKSGTIYGNKGMMTLGR